MITFMHIVPPVCDTLKEKRFYPLFSIKDSVEHCGFLHIKRVYNFLVSWVNDTSKLCEGLF